MVNFYVFGEFWNGDTETNDEYLESIDYLYDLIDVALHQNLFQTLGWEMRGCWVYDRH